MALVWCTYHDASQFILLPIFFFLFMLSVTPPFCHHNTQACCEFVCFMVNCRTMRTQIQTEPFVVAFVIRTSLGKTEHFSTVNYEQEIPNARRQLFACDSRIVVGGHVFETENYPRTHRVPVGTTRNAKHMECCCCNRERRRCFQHVNKGRRIRLGDVDAANSNGMRKQQQQKRLMEKKIAVRMRMLDIQPNTMESAQPS